MEILVISITLPGDIPAAPSTTAPPARPFFNLSFSSRSSRINLSTGFSLTVALFLIFFARSAYRRVLLEEFKINFICS